MAIERGARGGARCSTKRATRSRAVSAPAPAEAVDGAERPACAGTCRDDASGFAPPMPGARGRRARAVVDAAPRAPRAMPPVRPDPARLVDHGRPPRAIGRPRTRLRPRRTRCGTPGDGTARDGRRAPRASGHAAGRDGMGAPATAPVTRDGYAPGSCRPMARPYRASRAARSRRAGTSEPAAETSSPATKEPQARPIRP